MIQEQLRPRIDAIAAEDACAALVDGLADAATLSEHPPFGEEFLVPVSVFGR